MKFNPGYENNPVELTKGTWFIFSQHDFRPAVLTVTDGRNPPFPVLNGSKETGFTLHNTAFIGSLDNLPCFTGVIDNTGALPGTYRFTDMRPLFATIQKDVEGALARAFGISYWNIIYRFCTKCGAKLKTGRTETVKECPSCGHLIYPRISPAVIVLIRKGESILLAHNKRFPENLYSCIAGFVETGESLEDAVRREVDEETGIKVENLRYFGSQSWPFPNSLMLAFLGDYAGGEITLEDDDITDAGWFTRENLPDLPLKGSVSREMIEGFLKDSE